MSRIASVLAVGGAVALPLLIPPAPEPAPPSSAPVATVQVVPPPAGWIDWPGRVQGFAPPRWAYLAHLAVG